MRLSSALEGQPGLEAAHANLLGEVTLTWDDAVTSRDILTRRARGSRVPRAASGIAQPPAPFTYP